MPALFLLVFLSIASASEFISGERALLKPKSEILINSIGSELKDKTKAGLYVLLTDIKGTKQSRLEELKAYASKLSAPYFIIFFANADRKINFYKSAGFPYSVNEDEIFKTYIEDLLPNSKNIDESQRSAIILSAYSQIAYEIANSARVVLHSNIVDRSGDEVLNITRYLIYALVFTTFLIFIYIRIKRTSR